MGPQEVAAVLTLLAILSDLKCLVSILDTKVI